MADSQQEPGSPRSEPLRLNRGRLVAAALDAAALLATIVGAAAAIERFWRASRGEVISAGDLLAGLGLLVGGIAGGLALWGMSEALRKLSVLAEAFGERAPGGTRGSGSGGGEYAVRALTARSDEQERLLREIVGLMRESRDIALLTDAERAARQQIQARQLVAELEHEVPELLREHNWFEARKRVQSARERFPTLREWDALETQIEAVRAQVQSRDIETATRQVDELCKLGAWDRAQDAVNELLIRHPGAAGAIELARKLKVQRDQVEGDLRVRLMAQAQEFANRRDWQNALSTARTIMQRFPNSLEARSLREQLPTLEANAEVVLRRRMETEWKHCLANHNYGEAVRIARELIVRYPDSPQAAALHDKLSWLEEKASQHGQFV